MSDEFKSNEERELAAEWCPRPNRDYSDEYKEMQARCPLAYSTDFGGFWTLTRYEDVTKVLRDWRKFESGQPFVEFPNLPRSIPISINPPEHTGFRRFLAQFFTPERIEALRPAVETIVAEYLDPLIEAGHGDFASSVASYVPVRVLGAFLGLNEEGWRALKANLSHEQEVAGDLDKINQLQAIMWDAPVDQIINDRKREPRDPGTDLMSAVIQCSINGEPLSEDDVKAIGVQIFSAGAGTTVRAMTSVVVRLAQDVALQDKLRNDRGLVASFIEEALRLGPPVHHVARQPNQEVALHGVALPEGCNVALNFGAANLDEQKFESPSQFMLDRSPNPHLSFGHGVHQCLGAPVARLELSVLINYLLDGTLSFNLSEPALSIEAPVRSGYRRVMLSIDRHFGR
jgi:cytochrome P450